MNLNAWTGEQRGRSLWLANALGVTPPVVSDWCTGKKQVPLERCVAIERATEGAVSRRDLRPDDWQDIWPELADRQAPAPAQHPPADAPDHAAGADAGAAWDGIDRRINPEATGTFPDLERRAPLAAKLAGQEV